MNKITLLGTFHFEKNHIDSLYKIIEGIKPNVIFLEASDMNSLVYEDLSEEFDGIEILTIKKYIQKHDIEYILIDTFTIENLENPKDYHEIVPFILGKYDNDENAREYISHRESVFHYFEKNGLEGINTKEFDNLMAIEEQLFKDFIYNYRKDLIGAYEKYFDFVFNQRETEWINNIKNYFTENTKSVNAVLLVGASHRNSIIKKLVLMENINFDFYYKKANGT